jgi:hypothetical protein
MFGHDKKKRVKETLTEYMLKTLGYLKSGAKSGVTCVTLLNEYITHYGSEAAQPKSKQPLDFVHRLLGWYEIEVIKAQEEQAQRPSNQSKKTQDLIEFFESGTNHKELLYLFYTFLEQFDDSNFDDPSGPYMRLDSGNVKHNAMAEIIDMVHERGDDTSKSVNLVLQAIVHPKQMNESIEAIQKLVDAGKTSRMDKIISDARGTLKTGLEKVATLKDAVIKRSDMVTVRADIQSTMLNLTTVYQSLLFQVMMVVNDEPHPVCSSVPLAI